MPRPVSNPPNPWDSLHAEWLGEPPAAELQVFEEEARSIIAENDSPDVGFRFSVNPYRGCFHACAYCYARPTHQYLGWGAGTDFDRKIVAKTNAPELLRRELARRSWRGDTLVFSGVTDCYQPLEAVYGLTRRCLETCLEFRNPVGVVTKGALVRRDADLLGALAREADATVYVSIPFADAETARAVEPNVAAPDQRLEAIAALSAAGVPTGVAVAPVIPGLTDSDIPRILARARAAGATKAFLTLLPRLRAADRRGVPGARREDLLEPRADARRQAEREPFRRPHGGHRAPLAGDRDALRGGVPAPRLRGRRARKAAAHEHLPPAGAGAGPPLRLTLGWTLYYKVLDNDASPP
jgi:DNA repair photolyase